VPVFKLMKPGAISVPGQGVRCEGVNPFSINSHPLE
jgi:hypothetical protein